jgi:sulfonate dioxygenase
MPDCGSRYALYSSLSPFFQKYLESLSALHSAAEQAQGSRAAGTHVRREEIETIHPVVRVHPVTGMFILHFLPDQMN